MMARHKKPAAEKVAPGAEKSAAMGIIFAGLCVLVLYFPVFQGTHYAINVSDELNAVLTRFIAFTNSLKSLHFPLWNPYPNLGQIFSDGSVYPYHIGILLFLVFNPWIAHTLIILGAMWCLLFFSWVYFRAEGFDEIPALIGSIIYSLSGPVFFHHSYFGDIFVLFGLPLELYLLARWNQSGARKYFILFGVVLISTIISSNLDIVIQFLLCIFLYRLAHARIDRTSAKDIVKFALLLSAGLIASAVYSVPFAEWVERSSRHRMSYGSDFFPEPLNMAHAIIFGTFKRPHSFVPYYFFIGIPALFLSGIGLFRFRKGPLSVFCLLCLIFPLRYAIFYLFNANNITLLQNVDHWRSMFVFMLIIALAGARGADFLLKRARKLNAAGKCLTMAVILIPFIQNMYFARAEIRSSCIIEKSWINGLEKFWRDVGKAMSGESKGRVTGSAQFVSLAMLEGIRAMPAYTNVYNQSFHTRMEAFMKTKWGELNRSFWWQLRSPDAPGLAYYGVEYLIWDTELPDELDALWEKRKDITTSTNFHIYKNLFYKGRAYVVDRNGQMISRQVACRDVSSAVVVCRVKNAGKGERLILADQAYPGWKVTVNGTSAGWERFLDCLRAVELSEGDNTVIWRYSSRPFFFGLVLTGCALLTFGWLLLKSSCQEDRT